MGLREPRAYVLPEELKARIVRCKVCGLIYPDPMPYPDEATLAENYSDPQAYFPWSAVSEERVAFYRAILEDIVTLTGKPGRLLDVGCGRGELLLEAKKGGWDAVGVEPAARFAAEARRLSGAVVHACDVRQAGLTAGSFDAVALVSVLHNVHEPRPFLAAVRALLAPGGVLFIETMNQASPVYELPDLWYRLRRRAVTTHLSPTFPSFQVLGFSRDPLTRLLRETGFEPARVETRGGISRSRVRASGLRDWVLRAGLKTVMLASKAAGRGQVLVALARRAG